MNFLTDIPDGILSAFQGGGSSVRARLRIARFLSGLNLSETASEASVGRNRLSKFEKGEGEIVLEEILRVADALNDDREVVARLYYEGSEMRISDLPPHILGMVMDELAAEAAASGQEEGEEEEEEEEATSEDPDPDPAPPGENDSLHDLHPEAMVAMETYLENSPIEATEVWAEMPLADKVALLVGIEGGEEANIEYTVGD